MQQQQCDWAEVEAAFRAGESMTEIRKRFSVSLADILKRAKAAGWKHGETRAIHSNGGADNTGASALPVVVTAAATRAVKAAVDGLITDIVSSHKDITRKLRRRFEAELAEFDALTARLASFTDTDHIARLSAKADGGKELRLYLAQCLASHEKRTSVLERLGRIGAQVVNVERMVWGLDIEPTDIQATNWDAILADLRKPLRPLSLPNNVVEFERKMTVRGPETP